MRDKIWFNCVWYYSDEISTQLDIAEILLKEALNTIKQIKNKTNLVYIQT
jgi:hypothetical protein